ncbi:MAG TPA: crosslink repair DNA glycosylase YcaQ family protein [Candidatus Binatia bacterium]|nr:crosslink repair DNA glycosylase YcaQ family protein [Candidatus Binatia bacterium]
MPRPSDQPDLRDLPLLTARELNRATLARQGLLERGAGPLDEAVEAVGALQAQYAPAPPVALWSRVHGVTLDGYAAALDEHRLVTGLLMRGTIHVVSAREYWGTAAAVAGTYDGRTAALQRTSPVDLAALGSALLARLGEEPVRHAELGECIREWLVRHGHDPDDPDVARLGRWAWRAARASSAVLYVQRDGAWGRRAPDAYRDARAVLPPAPAAEAEDARVALVRHHLRAFGPAARDDVASWMGEPRRLRVDAALQALDPELARFRDEAGRVLYDVVDGPRPGGEAAAPVRFLPWFDSLLLAYAPRYRDRVLPEAHRPAVMPGKNAQLLATFLVDGTVAGTWELEDRRRQATVVLRPLVRLRQPETRALCEEGERLARFLRPEGRAHAVRVEGA